MKHHPASWGFFRLSTFKRIKGENEMSLIKSALIATVLVLVTVFLLNRIPFTSGIVQAALKPAA